VSGDVVCIELSIQGTFLGPFQTPAGPIKPTGAKIDFAAAAKHGVKTDGGTAAGPGAGVLAELAGLIADRHLDVPIANVYPLAQVREAYTELERRHTHGKIVLRP
jgi:NADPH:quinone reductase-like Zn-dependent oxidoreductase